MNTKIREARFHLTHTLVILFSGKAGVGKTYTAELAQEILKSSEFKVIKQPFATGVKNAAKCMEWDGRKDQRGRKLLQSIGKIGREYDPDMWVRSAIQATEDSVGYPYDTVIVDDWRFKNEIDYIQSLGLYKPLKIRVVAPERELLKGTPEYNDVSEVELDDYPFDYVIDNTVDGSEAVTNQLLDILVKEVLAIYR